MDDGDDKTMKKDGNDNELRNPKKKERKCRTDTVRRTIEKNGGLTKL